MERNKYIEVIDHYIQLLTKRTITREAALWAIHAVMLCAMKDGRITADDYFYICEYRDRVFE